MHTRKPSSRAWNPGAWVPGSPSSCHAGGLWATSSLSVPQGIIISPPSTDIPGKGKDFTVPLCRWGSRGLGRTRIYSRKHESTSESELEARSPGSKSLAPLHTPLQRGLCPGMGRVPGSPVRRFSSLFKGLPNEASTPITQPDYPSKYPPSSPASRQVPPLLKHLPWLPITPQNT